MSIEQVFSDLVNAINAQTAAIQANTDAIRAMGAGDANVSTAANTETSDKSAAKDDAAKSGKRTPRKTAADKAAEKAAAEAAAKEEQEELGDGDDNLDDDDDLFGDGAEEEETKTYTLDDVKEIMTSSVPVIGKPALVALLKKFGASKLTDLGEDKYAEFAGELESQIAAKQAA